MNTEKTYRALLIAPATQEITEISLSEPILDAYYNAIGNNCQYITQITGFVSGKNYHTTDFFGDDDILYREKDIVGGMLITTDDVQWQVVNNVVCIGHDGDGDISDCTASIESIQKIITWVSKEESIQYAKDALDAGFIVTKYWLMASTLNSKIYHYEISVNEAEYDFAYVVNDDKTIVRKFPENYDGNLSNLPKLYQVYGFEEWVRDNDCLRESLLQFSPEQDTWVDSEWEIPFTAFLRDDELVIKAYKEYFAENKLDL